MDDDIKDLIEDGILEPDEADDFENLDPEIQELVRDGEIDMDEAAEL